MDNALSTARVIVSLIIAVSLFAGWCRLIARKERALRKKASLQNPHWFIDIFRQSLTIIRRNYWILVVPLIAAFICFCDISTSGFRYLSKSEYPGYITEVGPAQLFNPFIRPFFALPLEPLISFLLVSFARINNEALSGLRSFPVTAFFLLWAGFVLLRPGLKSRDKPIEGHTGNPERRLGIVAILAGFSLLSILVLERTSGLGWILHWISYACGYAYLLSFPLAYTLLIAAIDRADRKQRTPFDAKSLLQRYFGPLFLFMLGVTVIEQLGSASYRTPDIEIISSVYQIIMSVVVLYLLLLGSFIPILVVVRRTSFLSAFNECNDIWARQGSNAGALVLIAGILFVFLELIAQILFFFLELVGGLLIRGFTPHHSLGEAILRLLVVLSAIALGVIIMCSMVVFCRKVLEEETTETQPEVI